MPDVKRKTRRRKWKRFRMKGGGIILLNKPTLIGLGKPELIELGPILDISMGGLAIQYIENKNRLIECIELSIAIPPEGIKLKKIPFQIVSDIEILKLPDSKIIRRRSVQFIDMTSYHKLHLQSLIRGYGSHIITDRRSGTDRRHLNDPRFEDDAFRAEHDRRYMGERRESP